MKKILSVVLAFCVLLSVSCVTSFSLTDADITSTGARDYQVSQDSDMTTVNGYVYGIVGDADFDDKVTILDATTIQLYVAQLHPLIATARLIADVDRDNQLTVIDATQIQMFISQLIESDTINRVLYTPFDNFDPMLETFEDISSYLLENGFPYYYTKDPVYSVHETYEIEGVEFEVHVNYAPHTDTINISSEYVDGGFLIQSGLTIHRGDPKFIYMVDMYNGDFSFHDSGEGLLSNISDEGHATFDLDYSKSALEEFPEDVLYATIAPICLMNLTLAEYYFEDIIVGTVLDLVYDVTTLI